MAASYTVITDTAIFSVRVRHTDVARPSLAAVSSPERIDFKLAVLVYRCLHGLAPRYLSDHIQLIADSNCRRLQSSSSMQLAIRRRLHGCPLSATVRFRWPDAAFGTVCHPMLRQLQRSLFFSESPQDTPLLKIISCIPFNCFSVPISYTVDSSGLAVST